MRSEWWLSCGTSRAVGDHARGNTELRILQGTSALVHTLELAMAHPYNHLSSLPMLLEASEKRTSRTSRSGKSNNATSHRRATSCRAGNARHLRLYHHHHRRASRAPSPILVDEASEPCRGSCSHEQCFEGFPDRRFYKVGSAFRPASLRGPDRWGQRASWPHVGGAQRSPGLIIFAEP